MSNKLWIFLLISSATLSMSSVSPFRNIGVSTSGVLVVADNQLLSVGLMQYILTYKVQKTVGPKILYGLAGYE
jgi:hypothetical protein